MPSVVHTYLLPPQHTTVEAAAALSTIYAPSLAHCLMHLPVLFACPVTCRAGRLARLNSRNPRSQDPHGGLGPLLPGWQPRSAAPSQHRGLDWQHAQSQNQPPGTLGGSTAASTVGDFDVDDFSLAETGPVTGTAGSDVGFVQRLPDFRSMLEAALRGDAVRAGSLPALWPRQPVLLLRGNVGGLSCSVIACHSDGDLQQRHLWTGTAPQHN